MFWFSFRKIQACAEKRKQETAREQNCFGNSCGKLQQERSNLDIRAKIKGITRQFDTWTPEASVRAKVSSRCKSSIHSHIGLATVGYRFKTRHQQKQSRQIGASKSTISKEAKPPQTTDQHLSSLQDF
ncbi:hypothetical protein PoB_006644500 [Plakobranchus ocellatus]|uniref:Uncharacterized protein n=1 Tax=Plakobranchus ocellatus TaxID=259542 RepID=A0AAV4D734_9GAST|nr:hypothetical protein PoB_006644500 [Plakobranchus ocellatus]